MNIFNLGASVLNFVSGRSLELMNASLIVNVRSHLIFLYGFELLVSVFTK